MAYAIHVCINKSMRQPNSATRRAEERALILAHITLVASGHAAIREHVVLALSFLGVVMLMMVAVLALSNTAHA